TTRNSIRNSSGRARRSTGLLMCTPSRCMCTSASIPPPSSKPCAAAMATDTSRVAVTLAKQRLMAADFDYYELMHPEEGVGSGFRYKTVPHVTLKSIANNPEIREGMTREQIDAAIARYADQETLYDQPYIDKSRIRVTGPHSQW